MGGALHLCCKQLKYILQPLRGNYHAFRTLVDKLKDGYVSRRVRIALTEVTWLRQFRYVDWFSQECYRASEWGTSCKCHEEQYARGEKVECNEKGRMLPWAWAKVQEVTTNMLGDCNSWDVSTWGGARIFWKGCRVWCVLLTEGLCKNLAISMRFHICLHDWASKLAYGKNRFSIQICST